MRKSIPKSVRKQVYAKYNGHCAYCGCYIPEKAVRSAVMGQKNSAVNVMK
jgi:hypothetical protein